MLLIAAVVIWCGNLDYRKLSLSDEGRYSEIPRYMAQSGDWVTPRLNGIKYFEKPPLQYWATAAAYRVFGEHNWTARSWPALTGLLGILLMWWVGTRLSTAAAAGSVYRAGTRQQHALRRAGPHPHARHGARIFSDAGVRRHRARARPARRRRDQSSLDAGRCRGLRVRGAQQGTDRHRAAGCSGRALHADQARFQCLLAQAAPRSAAACCSWRSRRPGSSPCPLANPEFAWNFFFVHEHFQRYTTTIHQRYQPWYFFIPILAAPGNSRTWLIPLVDAVLHVRANGSAKGRDFFDPHCCSRWDVGGFHFRGSSPRRAPSCRRTSCRFSPRWRADHRRCA